MKLSILIVNWNSKEFLHRCLSSLRQTCAELSPQIIVVDGGSFDGCGDMLAKEFPKVEFVQSPHNIGFGRSNNLGFERVVGEYVLLLNPDTEVRAGAIQTLLQEMPRLPHAGLLGLRLLNADGSMQDSSVQALPTPINQAVDSALLRRLFPEAACWGQKGVFNAVAPVEVEAVSGACMLLRSSDFRNVGGFTPQYFMYAEDMDLCLKIKKAGLKVYYVPNAEVVHFGGGSSRTQFSKFSAVMMREALQIYMRRNHGCATAMTYRFLMGVSAFVRLLALISARAAISREANATSFAKWRTILRWSLGLERWAQSYGAGVNTGNASLAAKTTPAKSAYVTEG